MTEADVIDRAAFDALLELVADDQEFLVELLQTYFDDSPGYWGRCGRPCSGQCRRVPAGSAQLQVQQ